jgi:hypothetical protein
MPFTAAAELLDDGEHYALRCLHCGTLVDDDTEAIVIGATPTDDE